MSLLWRDRLGQISLATTTLFWGAGATLQFIVIDWTRAAFGYSLSQASYLQGVVAVGIAIGAVAAARLVTLRSAVRVLPLGVAMGIVVMLDDRCVKTRAARRSVLHDRHRRDRRTSSSCR